jgi:hypothetical protein
MRITSGSTASPCLQNHEDIAGKRGRRVKKGGLIFGDTTLGIGAFPVDNERVALFIS